MKDLLVQSRTRKRPRRESLKKCKSSSSWSTPLFWMFAIAIVASPHSSSSSSISSWAVRATAAQESNASNGSNTEKNTDGKSNDNLSSNSNPNSEPTVRVRGGSRSEGGRAFVRQQKPRAPDAKQRDLDESNLLNADETETNSSDSSFMDWCKDSLGVDVSMVEIDHFEYPNYIRAMEDRIDIFCEDCNDDNESVDNENNEPKNGDSKETITNDGKQKENDTNVETSNEESSTSSTPTAKLDYLDDTDRYLSVSEEYPPVSVRGLKAAKDISIGDVVLSIPHNALWTIHNAIDASGDYHLVTSMGPEAREKYEWECPGMDEIPLLAVVVLYHMDQRASGIPNRPDLEPFLSMLPSYELRDSIPHLWSSRKLRKEATPLVRSVAKGIRQDVVDAYNSIMVILIENYPDVFGERGSSEKQHEWMFSLEKFHWAFALVNSRHWHLPIPDDPMEPFPNHQFYKDDESLSEEEALVKSLSSSDSSTNAVDNDRGEAFDSTNDGTKLDETHEEDDHESFSDQEGPPAATPTDEWVVIQDRKLREEEEREMQLAEEKDGASINATTDENLNNNNNPDEGNNSVVEEEEYWPPGNSFLAPLADLLNFGPPCTRGIYNPEAMAFEIVATCEFQKGQEITFWYADACEDVFVANYGFTMPDMVHKCPPEFHNPNHKSLSRDALFVSNSDESESVWQQQQQDQQVQYLEDELHLTYEELDRLDQRLDYLMNVLEDCHCGNQTELLAGAFEQQHEKDIASKKNSGSENFPEATASDETNDGIASTEANSNIGDSNNSGSSSSKNVSNSDSGSASSSSSSSSSILPRSPSPPRNHSIKSTKGGGKPADAQHAIRERRSRKGGTERGQRPQERQRHKKHHAMTRFRSRSRHHERRFDLL